MFSQEVTYLGALVAGLLSFLSPCVLPLIPSYLTYITGLSFAELRDESASTAVRSKTIFHSLCFVLGFTAVFVMLGASATMLGSLIGQYMSVVRKVGGVLIFIFGLHITGLVPISFLLGEKRIAISSKPAGYAGSFLVGTVFAAGWTPCIGPILGSILALAATEQNITQGVLLLLFYSLGLAIPFLLSALAVPKFLFLFNRFKKFIRLFEIFTGIFLMLVGLLIYFDWLSKLSVYATMLFGGF
jgi:cytochrome c-type biogenesis protein